MTTGSSIACDLSEACRAVLDHFRIDRSDCLLALTFGSRARAQERAPGDFDLIFVVQPKTSYPDFAYERLEFGDNTIDANIIQPDFLDVVCRGETGWAYRFFGARIIPALTGAPRHLADAWLQAQDALIRHPLACRRRLLGHLVDCRALLRNLYRLESMSPEHSAAPALSAYLMIEVLFQLPLIQLNLLGLVPFEDGNPWSSARAADATADPHAHDDYAILSATVSRSNLYANVALEGAFADNLKSVRDRCRSAVIQHIGYVFADGFGKVLAEKAKGCEPLQSELAEILAGVRAPGNELVDAVANWTGNVLGRVPAVAARAGRRKTIPRRKSKVSGARLVDYRPEAARLKIILPTGGCRVPTCTFCMLPYMARAKGDIEPILVSAADAIGKRPVRQVAVYTDGSFFDERELTSIERLSITDRARQWGATELLVETLPRFLTPAALDAVRRALGPGCRLRIGIGLQSTDPLVRNHITGTPITQSELLSLLAIRQTDPFALRLYLLANKPMMTASEDLLDLRRSLDMLDDWLAPEDVVTINPLLPTSGTLVEKLDKAGCWQPLERAAVDGLALRLQASSRRYTLEFGPTAGATCTDSNLDVRSAGAIRRPPGHAAEPGGIAVEALPLCWSLLGGYRSRSIWAQTGAHGFLPSDQDSAGM